MSHANLLCHVCFTNNARQIFKIHTRAMNIERDIRFELLARLCPNSTGADIRRCVQQLATSAMVSSIQFTDQCLCRQADMSAVAEPPGHPAS